MQVFLAEQKIGLCVLFIRHGTYYPVRYKIDNFASISYTYLVKIDFNLTIVATYGTKTEGIQNQFVMNGANNCI